MIKWYHLNLFKGDLYTATPSAKIVDISHSIPPYDIVTGAFFLKNVYATTTAIGKIMQLIISAWKVFLKAFSIVAFCEIDFASLI